MPRNYVNNPNSFCYTCGYLTFKAHMRNIIALTKKKKAYEFYFDCKLDQNQQCALNICCVSCATLLTGWMNGTRHMPFAIPLQWREHLDHLTDCYFCLTNIS